MYIYIHTYVCYTEKSTVMWKAVYSLLLSYNTNHTLKEKNHLKNDVFMIKRKLCIQLKRLEDTQAICYKAINPQNPRVLKNQALAIIKLSKNKIQAAPSKPIELCNENNQNNSTGESSQAIDPASQTDVMLFSAFNTGTHDSYFNG